MTNEEREDQQIDLAKASATRLERLRCLKAVDREPNDQGGLAEHYLYKTIVEHVKANIRRRIEEGV